MSVCFTFQVENFKGEGGVKLHERKEGKRGRRKEYEK
jgi:hypothetical protein